MSDEDHFLARWSRRKSIARAGGSVAPEPAAASLPLAPQSAAPDTTAATPVAEATSLPPVESLTADSDFAPFMRADVDPQVKRDALKVLLRDPRFNVMDRLDVYIDDYSQPDPLPAGWLEKLNQVAFLGDASAGSARDEERSWEKPGLPAEPPVEAQPPEASVADAEGDPGPPSRDSQGAEGNDAAGQAS